LRLTLVTLVLTGLAYPLAMTGIARMVFPHCASGSLVVGRDGRVVGSELIGQAFHGAAYFQLRPSAAGSGYDASNSGGSNLAPASARLLARLRDEAARLQRENPKVSAPIPVELLTASASGLDPHISPAAALWQVPRVARARRLDEAQLRALVVAHVEPRQLGVFGEPRVNVLLLNLALDRK